MDEGKRPDDREDDRLAKKRAAFKNEPTSSEEELLSIEEKRAR